MDLVDGMLIFDIYIRCVVENLLMTLPLCSIICVGVIGDQRSVMFSPLLLLLILSTTTSAITISNEYPLYMHVQMLHDVQIDIRWRIDWQFQFVHFAVQLQATAHQWVAIGFSDHGEFVGSDFCMRIGKSVQDGWVAADGRLTLDRSQDCTNATVYGDTAFVFSRKFQTCDPKDYAIEIGTTQFFIAVGDAHSTMNINDKRVQKRIVPNQLLRPMTTESMMNVDEKVIKVGAINAHVPADETTYWCAIVNMAEIDPTLLKTKHHALKLEAEISEGSEHLVHHMEIFHCNMPADSKPLPNYNGNCNSIQSRCTRVLAAWAMGAGPIEYPKEAGMVLGGVDFYPYVMVEVHYNNPGRIAGIVDNSGMRIHYTSQLRQHDAGILELGLIYSETNSIPALQSAFVHNAYCVADCTNKLPAGGMHIFATQLHAHLTGRKLWTSHYRNGIKIGEINRDNHYSPHWQHIQHLRRQITVLPGDVLVTTCVYDTRKRSTVTLGGYGIADEMCVNYVHYYPASTIEVCKSAIDNRTLHNFFNQLFGRNVTKMGKTSDMFALVNWNAERVDQLVELYSVAPLNMHCLDHSGMLFPGHAQNWTNVPRPTIKAGPYDTVRGVFECPSIND